MDFSISARHADIARRMAALGRELNDGQLGQRDGQSVFDQGAWRRLCQEGLHAVLAPAAHGGQDYGALDLVCVLEALGEHCEDTGLLFALAAHLCACVRPLCAHASPAQQSHWLGRIGREGLIGAHAITEPDAGSDVSAMTTVAVREGDGGGYRMSGRKRYITNAPVCDFILVHVRTAHTGGFLDYTAFVLDRHAQGVHIDPAPHEKVGLRTAAMGDIVFDSVRLDSSHRLGAEGNGGPIFHAAMQWERTCLFALYLGTMRRQLRQVLNHAQSRQSSGKPLVEHQAVSHRIAEMQVRYESARLACLQAAWELDHGQATPATGIAAKLLVSQAAIQNGLDALHVHGASGVLAGDVERQLRNALPSTLFSGTNDVLKNQLVRHLITESRRRAPPTPPSRKNA